MKIGIYVLTYIDFNDRNLITFKYRIFSNQFFSTYDYNPWLKIITFCILHLKITIKSKMGNEFARAYYNVSHFIYVICKINIYKICIYKVQMYVHLTSVVFIQESTLNPSFS